MKKLWLYVAAINLIALNLIALGYTRVYEPLAVTRIDNLEVANYLQMTSSSGPTIKTIASDPSGAVVEPRGSLRIRTDTATVYQNTNAGTTWFDLTAAFTSTTKGLAPSSGGGTANFLRADGSWSVPSTSSSNATWPFGTGIDGVATFDGATTVAGVVPAGNVYTFPTSSSSRDYYFSTGTVSNGVTVETSGGRFFFSGTLTNNGTIQNNGANGSAAVGGAAASVGVMRSVAPQGGAGGTNAAGSPGTNVTAVIPTPWTSTNSTSNAGTAGNPGTAGQVRFKGGGGGGGATANAGGTSGTVTVISAQGGGIDFFAAINGIQSGRLGAVMNTGSAGGGGGGGTAGVGGGGGGGGGWLVVSAYTIAGTGTMRSNGGNGANGTGTGGGGGGGGGGVCVVVYWTITGSQTFKASGGTHGNGGTGGNGGDGADGYVFAYNMSGDGTTYTP